MVTLGEDGQMELLRTRLRDLTHVQFCPPGNRCQYFFTTLATQMEHVFELVRRHGEQEICPVARILMVSAPQPDALKQIDPLISADNEEDCSARNPYLTTLDLHAEIRPHMGGKGPFRAKLRHQGHLYPGFSLAKCRNRESNDENGSCLIVTF